MEIVTGSTGIAHVTPIDDAVRNTHMSKLDEKVVFNVPHGATATRRAFYAEARTANEVVVYSGYGSNQGRLFKINANESDSVTIDSCAANSKRLDLITDRYTMDEETGLEDISLYVIKGTAGNSYAAPTPVSGDINNGALVDDFVLYKVYINGTVIDNVEAQFTPMPDGGRLGQIEAEFQNVLDRFDEIEEEFSTIPAEVAQAASKSYVNEQIGSLSASKANKYHNYSANEVNSNRNSIIGTSSVCGHLKCSDNYSDLNTESETAGGVALSQKGARAMYNELMTAFTDGCNGIATALTRKGVTPTKGENTVNYTPNDFANAIDKIKRKVHYKVTVTKTQTSSNGGTGVYSTTVNVKIGDIQRNFMCTDTGLIGFAETQFPKVGNFSSKSWTQNI